MGLAEYRKSQDLTQAELAELLGIKSKGTISAIETGAYLPGVALALRIERWSKGAVPAASISPEARELGAQIRPEALAAA